MKDGDFMGYLGKMVIYPLNVWIARNVKWEWGHQKHDHSPTRFGDNSSDFLNEWQYMNDTMAFSRNANKIPSL